MRKKRELKSNPIKDIDKRSDMLVWLIEADIVKSQYACTRYWHYGITGKESKYK